MKKHKSTLKIWLALKSNFKNLRIKLIRFQLKLIFILIFQIITKQVTTRTELKTFKIKLVNLRLLINQLRIWWMTKTINGIISGVNMSNRWRALLSKLMLIETSNPLERSWNKSKLSKPKLNQSKLKLLPLKSYSPQQSTMMNLTNLNKEFKLK